jgi:RNA polymerase sigma factor (sigma-70 family)
MAKAASSPVLQLIRRVVSDPRVRGCADEELLRRFLDHQDQGAFETLLRRHGPMVLDVCRGVLPNEADVEDAFQATFLVLARKAHSIRRAASLASWLHGVAYRAACQARTASARRKEHEARVPARTAVEMADELAWREVRQVVQEELSGLSERYRTPLVLCYLQGKTQDEAAALLGLAKSTLKDRLERGRALLRARLVRHGLGPMALLVVSAWPGATVSAGVPASLVTSTVKAATPVAAGGAAASVVSAEVAALAEGGARAMWLPNLKSVTVLFLAAALLVGGVAVLSYHALPAAQAKAPQAPSAKALPAQGAQPEKGKDQTLKLDEPVHYMRWSGNGQVMASLSKRVDKADGKDVTLFRFRVWDPKTGKLKLDLGEAEHPRLMTFGLSADGKVLAISYYGRIEVGDKVELFDTEQGLLLQTIEVEYSRSRIWFSISPDRRSLAVCGSDIKDDRLLGTVRLFDTKTGKLMKKLVSDGAGIISVAHSPDGKLIAAGSRKGEITVWEAATGKVVKTLTQPGGDGGWVGALAFSPDSKQVVFGRHESSVIIWDIGTNKNRELKGADFNPEDLVYSPDGRYVAAHALHQRRDEKDSKWRHGVRVWEAGSGELLHEWFTSAYGIAFTPDSKRLAIMHDPKTVKLMGIAGTGGAKPPAPADGKPLPEHGPAQDALPAGQVKAPSPLPKPRDRSGERPAQAGQLALADLIAKVRQNEKLYQDIDVVMRTTYDIGTRPPTEEREVIKQQMKTRFVAQGEWFRLERDGGSQDAKATVSMDRIRAFDGKITRVLEQNAVGNLSAERLEDENFIRPHLLLLRYTRLAVPLSVYLAGDKAIQAHPDGRWNRNLKMEVSYQGKDRFNGLNCHKVLVKVILVKSGEAHDAGEHWLAEDRNYLPVRHLTYTYRFSKDTPTGEAVVHKLREVKPGVWFPRDVEVTAYNKFKIQRNGQRELQWRERYTVERVELGPKFDRKFFTDVVFPAGTAVHEVAKGQIVRSWRQAAPGVADLRMVQAGKPMKGDQVKVEVEGQLASLARQANGRGPVSATVRAGGGELVLDYSQSKQARAELGKLADRYIKPGGAATILPRVTVTGRLEFRPTKVVGEKGALVDGPRAWVLVVESLAAPKAASDAKEETAK